MCYCLTHWAIPWYMWPSILYFILCRFYPMSTSPGLNSKDANSRIRCLCQWTQPDFKPDFLSRVLSLMDCPLLSIALCVDISSQKKKGWIYECVLCNIYGKWWVVFLLTVLYMVWYALCFWIRPSPGFNSIFRSTTFSRLFCVWRPESASLKPKPE